MRSDDSPCGKAGWNRIFRLGRKPASYARFPTQRVSRFEPAFDRVLVAEAGAPAKRRAAVVEDGPLSQLARAVGTDLSDAPGDVTVHSVRTPAEALQRLAGESHRCVVVSTAPGDPSRVVVPIADSTVELVKRRMGLYTES